MQSFTIPGKIRMRLETGVRALFVKSHSLFFQLAFALGSLLAAIITRLFVDPILYGHLPFITFFPALVAVAVICNRWITVGFALISAVIGSSLWGPPNGMSLYYQLVGSILFVLTGLVIMALAEGLKDAYGRLSAAEERLRTINGELIHRIRNLFQLSSAIVSQSARDASSAREVEQAVVSRLRALSLAQSIPVTEAGQASLTDLIALVLKPLCPGPDRLSIGGPEVSLAAPNMTMFALVLHELGTNAVKYGSWSGDKGFVEVRWRRIGPTLELEWNESGGPPVVAPKRSGAGTNLIRRAIPEAAVDYRLDGNGAKCRIEVSLGPSSERRS